MLLAGMVFTYFSTAKPKTRLDLSTSYSPCLMAGALFFFTLSIISCIIIYSSHYNRVNQEIM